MNNIIVTVSDEKFKLCLYTLISSLYKTSYQYITQILIFNLGLHKNTINFLKTLNKVIICEFDFSNIKSEYNLLDRRYYGFKPFALKFCDKYITNKNNANILYIDAGIYINKNIAVIFNIINNNHIFFVNHDDRKRQARVFNYCHPKTYKLLNVNKRELMAPVIKAGFIGYKLNGKYNFIIDKLFDYAIKKNIMCFPKFCKKIKPRNDIYQLAINKQLHSSLHFYLGARHDQTILSILCARYRCPIKSSKIFAYSIDKNVSIINQKSKIINNNGKYKLVINRNIKMAYTWIHRGTFINYKSINLYKKI